MNRRTFVKASGAVGLLGIFNISFAGQEQQWVSFLDQEPQKGQKIIIGGVSNHKNSYLCGGTVASFCTQSVFSDDYITVLLKRDFLRTKHNPQDAWVFSFHSVEGKKMIKTKEWMRYSEKPSLIKNHIELDKSLLRSKFSVT